MRRALQGLGAALVAPTSLAIIADTLPRNERGLAIGIWAAVSASALGLGPLFGAIINDSWGWRWIFLVNVPVHFPSEVELETHGVVTRVASEPEILRRLSSNRFDEVATLEADALNSVAKNVNDLRLQPWSTGSSLVGARGPWISGLIRYYGSFRRVGRDHRAPDTTQRKTFDNALATLEGNPAWQSLMNYHVGGVYRMHSMHGPVGTQRFLSWHRKYLFDAEQMLRAVEPTVTIPYWDYATDAARPDWVHRPAGVSRPMPGAPGFLPSGGTITTILGRADHANFTLDVENNAHNQVPNWGKGTLQNPSTCMETSTASGRSGKRPTTHPSSTPPPSAAQTGSSTRGAFQSPMWMTPHGTWGSASPDSDSEASDGPERARSLAVLERAHSSARHRQAGEVRRSRQSRPLARPRLASPTCRHRMTDSVWPPMASHGVAMKSFSFKPRRPPAYQAHGGCLVVACRSARALGSAS